MTKRFASILVAVSFAIGALLTVWGLGHMAWPEALPFSDTALLSDSALRRYLALLSIYALLVLMGAKWSRRSPIVIGVTLSVGLAMLAGALWALLVTLWFALASAILGRAILSVFRIEKDSSNRVFSFLVGAGTYGTAVGLLAHFPANYPGVYGVALAAPLILGWRSLLELGAALGTLFAESGSLQTRVNWLEVAIAVVALVHFSVALMPEVGHDALAMHLFIPGHLAARHEWGFDVNTYVWAVMPMLGDWLFSIGYMLAGEQAARLINVGFIFVLGWLIRDLVLWAGGNAIGARWAVLLFLTTPLTFTESSSLFIESIWTAFVVAGSLAVFKLVQSDDDQATHLPTAGILLGGALAAKAVTFIILPVLFLVLVWRYRAWAKPRLIGAIALGLVLFLAIGSIPYATAWYLTANPVFPFFNHIFQSPHWPAVAFEPPTVFAKGLTWDVLYQVTFHSEKFLESRAGSAGFQWLLMFTPALLILLAARHNRGLVLFVVAALSVALTFQSIAYLRYVFPSFAWVAAGIGVAISVGYTGSVVFRRFLFVIGWTVILLNVAFFESGTNYGDLSPQALVSKTGRETYLNNRLPIRNAVELVNNFNTGHTPVAVFSSPLAAGLNSDGLYPNWYNYRFNAKVSETKTSGDMAELFMDQGVDYVILDNNWGTLEKRMMIEGVTQKLNASGSITVRKLDDSYRFQTELLKNPGFLAFDGWTFFTNKSGQAAGQVAVTVTAPASQPVSVVPGRRYQNSVTAKCGDQPTQGRLQVNWLNSKGSFITTDINVFDCTPAESTQTMKVTAPANATTAIVYAAGHSNVPIIITKVSFRQ